MDDRKGKKRENRTVWSGLRAILALVAVLGGMIAQPARGAQPSGTLQLPGPEAQGTQRCFKCHGDSQITSMTAEALAGMVRVPLDRAPVFRPAEEIPKLLVTPASFETSAHGKMQCTECHTGVSTLPHDQQQTTKSCQDCHTTATAELASGPHSNYIQDGRERPTCAQCHGHYHTMRSLKQPRSYDSALAILDMCTKCHVKTDMPRADQTERYADTIHGSTLIQKGLAQAPTCVECHGNHAVLPATDAQSPVNPRRAPETCGKCHEGIVPIYRESIHGQMLAKDEKKAASCTSCHASHGVAATDRTFLLSTIRECSDCHLDLAQTYLQSYHGKAAHLGSGDAAVCSSCHGHHDIQPAKDPRSRVNAANLQQTCSACHENVNQNFVKYITHTDFRNPEKHPVVFWTWVVMMTLVVGTLSVFLPHSFLWFQRTLLPRLFNPMGHHLGDWRHGSRMVRRFHIVHRITHFLIIVSFMGLVATGFPLKYSTTDWAVRIAGLFGGVRIMGFIHRFLACLTLLYVAIHLTYLAYFFLFRCPRPIWKFLIGPNSMIFSWRDAKDAFAMLRWFLWLGPRPKLDRWTYFEKFDYFGEMWGVVVIGVTGLMLWAPQWFTRWLPGWILNCATVVHSTEALLAASVIFLVHFFNTHLRPEKFPIDMVMLTGQMSENEMIEERGAEYNRLVAEGKLEERIVKPMPVHVRLLGGIVGIATFLFGIFLIALALSAEYFQISESHAVAHLWEEILKLFR